MNTRFALILALTVLCGRAHAQDAPKPATAGKPNIVFIFADDLGYGDTGCYGATKVKTPNIDLLARQGRRFTDAHAASSVCSPSRYALLTGEYPFRKNLWAPLNSSSQLVIDPSRTTMASMLKSQGYATACFGKWHLGFGSKPKPDWNADLKPGPLELGFDHYFGNPVVSSFPPYVWVEDHRVVGLDPADPLVYGGNCPTEWFPEKTMRGMSGAKAAHALYRDEELATTVSAKSNAWIRDHKDSPFFLYLATPLIHHPFTPGPRFKGTSQCGLYGDFVQEFDWMVGEVMHTLDDLKLADNTLVIFTSDNGGMLNLGGQAAWKMGHHINGDLLGFKFDAWEGGHREPFIARWPGHIEPGSISDQLICHVDMLATLAAVTGYTLKPDDAPDSFNVLPALVGKPSTPIRNFMVFAPNKETNLGLRLDHWDYIGAQGGGGWNDKSGHLLGGPAALQFTGEKNSDIANGKIKPDAPRVQLYNMTDDLRETTNVAADHPEIVKRMAERLKEIEQNPRSRP
jgi:arylsulfatase A-like enzyme